MRITIRLDQDRVGELLNEHRPDGIRSINVLAPVHSGLSGATVWQIDLQSEGTGYNGFGIAKFDEYDRLTREKDRTQAAVTHPALEQRVPKVLALSPPITEHDEQGNPYTVGFLLLTYARDGQVNHIESLQAHVDRWSRMDRGRITDQVMALVEPLFEKWYGSVGWTATRQPLDVPATVRNLLNIGSDEDRLARMDQRIRLYFDVNPTAQRLLVVTPEDDPPVALENPAYVLQHEDLWLGHSLTIASCPMHGDLHSGNIICQVKRSGERSAGVGPYLIDFANHEPAGVFFYDLAQLEFDIFSRFLPHATSENWQDWLHLLEFISGDAVLPEGEPQGDRAPHAWKLIEPIRRFVQQYVAQTKAHSDGGVEIQLERAWWLAMLSVGLRAAQRSKVAPGVRSAGLVYAGLALRRLPHHPVPDPNEVALLQWYPAHGLRGAPPKEKRTRADPSAAAGGIAAAAHATSVRDQDGVRRSCARAGGTRPLGAVGQSCTRGCRDRRTGQKRAHLGVVHQPGCESNPGFRWGNVVEFLRE